MASGTINGSTSASYIGARVLWSATPVAGENKSTLSYTFQLRNTASGGHIEGTTSYRIYFGSTTIGTWSGYVTSTAQAGWTTVFTGSKVISHNADGTKSGTFKVTGGMTSSASVYTSTNLSATITFDTITLDGSTFTSGASADVGGTLAITITPVATGVYHEMHIYIDTTYTSTVQIGQATSYTFTVPSSWKAGTSGGTAVGHITLTTYDDSGYTTQHGNATTGTFQINYTAIPPVLGIGWATAVPHSDNAAVESWGIAVQGLSYIGVTFDSTKVTVESGYTLASMTFSIGGVTYQDGDDSAVINTPGTLSIVCTATDSRGESSSETLTMTVYEYAVPNLAAISVYRSDSGGTATKYGTYATVKATAWYAGCNGNNSYTLTYAVQQVGGSYGSEVTLVSGTPAHQSGISTSHSYNVRITITDAVGNTATSVTLITTGAGILKGLQIADGGMAAAFGTEAIEANTLEVAYSGGLHISNGPLTIGQTSLSEADLIALLAIIS